MRGVLILFLLSFSADVLGMTRQQLKKTLTIMKNQCLTKTGVTDAKVGQIEQGVFIEEKNVMCYVACIYKTIQVVKNERLNKEMIVKQIDTLYPQDMKAAVKAAVDNCLDVQNKYDDPCAGIFYSVKCLYEYDPPNFVFP